MERKLFEQTKKRMQLCTLFTTYVQVVKKKHVTLSNLFDLPG